MQESTNVVIALLVTLAVYFAYRQWRKPRQAARPEVYEGLRRMMLQSSRSQYHLPEPATPTTPWGAIMDWGLPHGTATVVAMADGHASIYLSGGGGYLGGAESHPSIRRAARNMVVAAADVEMPIPAAEPYPLPDSGGIIFYLLTDSGIFTASASEDDLRAGQGPLARLGNAAQAVITEYRRLDQK